MSLGKARKRDKTDLDGKLQYMSYIPPTNFGGFFNGKRNRYTCAIVVQGWPEMIFGV